MRTSFRVTALILVLSAIAPAPQGQATPPPPQMAPACFSITTTPCTGCPGIRSKVCNGDPTGLFASCTETQSTCDGTHYCSDVATASGPACGN